MTETDLADWLFFVESDITAAKIAAQEEIYHIACFHVQQAAEKLLKACLAKKGKAIPRIHSLIDLYERVRTLITGLEEYKIFLKKLNTYYLPTRYPEALPGSLPEGLPTKEDAVEALKDVEKFSAFIKTKIKSEAKIPKMRK